MEPSSRLEQQIKYLHKELEFIKQQNKRILSHLQSNQNATEHLKQLNLKLISFLAKNKSVRIKHVNPLITVQNLHNNQISAILELGSTRIATGSKDGVLAVSEVNYSTKQWNIVSKLNNAHSSKIWTICELPNNRLVSGSFDKLIKIWHLQSRSKLVLAHVFKEHSGGIDKVISLTNNRIASCSYDDHTVKVWNSEPPYNTVNISFDQLIFPNSIIQLNCQHEVICISGLYRDGGNMYFYELNKPYQRKGVVEKVWTNLNNGLVELRNGDIAVSKGDETPCIYIINGLQYVKVAEIFDDSCIIDYGALCSWGNRSFIYACKNAFCQIDLQGGEYKIVYKQIEQEDVFGWCSLVKVNGGKHIIVKRLNGFNVFEVN